jgi:hypothetical protein
MLQIEKKVYEVFGCGLDTLNTYFKRRLLIEYFYHLIKN